MCVCFMCMCCERWYDDGRRAVHPVEVLAVTFPTVPSVRGWSCSLCCVYVAGGLFFVVGMLPG